MFSSMKIAASIAEAVLQGLSSQYLVKESISTSRYWLPFTSESIGEGPIVSISNLRKSKNVEVLCLAIGNGWGFDCER